MAEITEIELLSAFENPHEYEVIIKGPYTLCNIAKTFPEYAEILINYVLNSLDEFERIVTCMNDLLVLVKQFPNQGEKLINIVFENSNIFNNLTIDADDVCRLAEVFPHHAKAIITPFLISENDIRRLIVMNSDLPRLAQAFPQYKEIFSKPTIEEAISEVVKLYALKNSENEIRKNSNIFKQASKTNTGPEFFKDVPLEIATHIISFTRNPDVHSEAEAISIAVNSLGSP